MDYLSIYEWLFIIAVVAGFVWWSNKKAYEKGITTAVLLHREGRLKYKDYDDEDGVGMVDIQIAPTDED